MHFTYCPYCGSKAIQKEIGDEGKIPYCTQCKIPLWDMFITSIICAVVNEQKEIALLRQNYVSQTHFVCLAGVIKMGETAEETVRREVKEEIGLDVEWLEYIETYPYPKKEMLMLGYKVYVKKDNFTLSKEVDSVEWVPLENALEKLREGSIAWKLVKQCRYPIIASNYHNNFYKDIALIRTRPGMFIGNNKISTLRTFLDGYHYAQQYFHERPISLEPLPFFLFHEFVANYYHESACMGWNRIILQQTNNNEEEGLKLFFELFDIFRSIKIVNCQVAELTPQNIVYHNTVNTVYKQCIRGVEYKYNAEGIDSDKDIKVPIYIHSQKVYCVKLTDNYGYLLLIEYPDALCFTHECNFIMSEKNIKKYMEYNFGQMQWDMADKTVFSKKSIYQDRIILDEEGHYKYN
mgnify:FL=1